MTIPFPRRTAVRPSPVFLLLLAITAAGGWLAWQADQPTHAARVGAFVFVIGAWLVTLSLHEFAHAYLAWRFGDREVEARGYLTLNPFKYSHPLLSIVLPVLIIAVGGIGLPGGAVWLHPQYFRTNLQRALVSLSGPLVNLGFTIGLLALTDAYGVTSSHGVFWLAVCGLALLQLTATVLNLLPIPGLDGWGMLEPYLDPSVQQGAAGIKPFGMLLLFALLQIPSINTAFFNAIFYLFDLSPIGHLNGQIGVQLIQFWRN